MRLVIVSTLITLSMFCFADAMDDLIDSTFGPVIKNVESGSGGEKTKAVSKCLSLAKEFNGFDAYKGKTVKTAEGDKSFDEVIAYCTAKGGPNAGGAYVGCGKTSVDIEAEGSKSNWGSHTFHPASMSGTYTASSRPAYKEIDCSKMPKQDKVDASVKPFAGGLKAVCGKDAIITTPTGGFSTEALGGGKFKRTALTHCFVKKKADWAQGKVRFDK